MSSPSTLSNNFGWDLERYGSYKDRLKYLEERQC